MRLAMLRRKSSGLQRHEVSVLLGEQLNTRLTRPT